MAAPHVARAVALIWQAKPSLIGKIDKTETLLKKTAVPLKSTQNCGGSGRSAPNNVSGWGLLDILQAVQGR